MSESRRSQRGALLVLGAVAVLALGFALGAFTIKMQKSEYQVPAADSVAVGFSQDMISHHLQAVDMAATAYANSTDPAVRTLAFDILTSQQAQIGYMEGWLKLWDRPLRAVGPHMEWMAHAGSSGHGEHGGSTTGSAHPPMASSDGLMPGMATNEELSALSRARGAELDVLFLQLMLRHHQGGTPMMAYGAEHAEVADVRNLAESMLKTQQGETDLMTRMLRERGAQPLPMN
jgi:uncharacterized protein (DUF305 family)